MRRCLAPQREALSRLMSERVAWLEEGGIPGAENRLSFALVCALLLGLGALQVWTLRRRHGL